MASFIVNPNLGVKLASVTEEAKILTEIKRQRKGTGTTPTPG